MFLEDLNSTITALICREQKYDSAELHSFRGTQERVVYDEIEFAISFYTKNTFMKSCNLLSVPSYASTKLCHNHTLPMAELQYKASTLP